jgi:LDH2 family malate/lactate/ureidoglycolate dehydrogenase
LENEAVQFSEGRDGDEVSARLYHWQRLEQVAASVFARVGVEPRHAEIVARSLVHADLRGVESHGLMRMPIYVKRIEAGLVDIRTHPRVTAEEGATCLLDGQNQLGAVVGTEALQVALEKAERHGVGFVGVHASNHFGACSFYAEQAMEQGMILIIMSNAPQVMAPTGGIRPFFGSNPLAVGIPTGTEPPYLLDMATTVAARGKIALAAKKGEPIPADWAIDDAGNPTTDPERALSGSLLPIGGAKGYGMAMFIDMLSGVLTGAGCGPEVTSLYDNWTHRQNVGHVFLAIRIERFVPLPVFRSRMDEYIRQIKAVPRAEGTREILIPGEKEWRTARERRVQGIPLPDAVANDLGELFRQFGADLDDALFSA